MDSLLRWLVRTATRRGMRGEHWAWFVLAAGAYLLQRSRRREPPVVFSRQVKSGERLLVSIRSPHEEPAGEALPG
jgi:hypothetical protein